MPDYSGPFGDPKARDFVGEIEKSMDGVITRTTEHFNKAVDRIAPRPIGSVKSTPDEAFHDYLTTIASAPDPKVALEGWITEKASQYGLTKALDMAADMVLENEARLAEFDKNA